jgi:NAD+ synthase (glutamine-hydrolysing)
MKIATYQFNPTIGDLVANTDKILHSVLESKANGCDLFLVPELAMCGYPPEDLLLREDFHHQIEFQLKRFLLIDGITLVITAPYKEKNICFNSAFVIKNAQVIKRYDKHSLPNYGVFDDKRYFSAGSMPCVFECAGTQVGVVICEDMWNAYPIMQAKSEGAELICVLNASPFSEYKYEERLKIARQRVSESQLPILYVNAIGGQDEIIYDGASFALNKNGGLVQQLSSFKEELAYSKYTNQQLISESIIKYPEYEERIYNALVLSLKDYVTKNAFKGIVLGLSGGIDSALTLAIAVDALGASNVVAVMMPSVYTADISVIDAQDMVKRLQISNYHEVEINPIFSQFDKQLAPIFSGMPNDLTEENLQARIRGTLLMAISNKFGYLVLTTGNKSEVAMGYATLYGDMAGGFAPLKDVLKTLVYRLSKWRNTLSEVIPERIIARAPSAELRANQTDQDSLPDYDVLDKIIKYLVEGNLSSEDIIARGLDAVDVKKVARLLKLNEYKRRQSAVGPKVTLVSFAKDWRYPITHRFNF